MAPKITGLYTICGIATMGGLLQGFSVSSLAAILATDQYKEYFHHPESIVQGGIIASLAGGCLSGSLFSSWVGDRIGRRDSMLTACCVFLVGCSIMTAVQNRAMLIVARVINGFAVGLITSQGPIYIAEISPAQTRGRLMSFHQWMITWGILIMYYVSYGASYIKSTASFRLPWALQMIPAAILLCCLPLMPRSPRWLATRGRWEEAAQVLVLVRAKGDYNDAKYIAELQEIKDRVEQEKEFKSTSWLEVVSRQNLFRLHVALSTPIWAQLSGLNALMYYIVYIFQMAGLEGTTNLTISSIQYVINVVMTVPALLFVDKLPRRWVMMTGSLILSALLFSVGAIMGRYGHPVPGGLPGTPAVTWTLAVGGPSKAIIVCSYLFIATYACTWGPLAWIYPTEISPLYLRSKVVSLATVNNWICNFTLTLLTPLAFQNIQWRFYMIFGSITFAAFIHVFLFFQETKGKTLEEMNDIFNHNTFAFGRVQGFQSSIINRARKLEGRLPFSARSITSSEKLSPPASCA